MRGVLINQQKPIPALEKQISIFQLANDFEGLL